MVSKKTGRGPIIRVTPNGVRREQAAFPKERRAYRRGLIIFWVFVLGGLALAIWIATLHPSHH